MSVLFVICGRLGNALFRYLACSIFCIIYRLKFSHNMERSRHTMSEEMFKQLIIADAKSTPFIINKNINYLFSRFYQHDLIYRKYKKELLEYMRINKDHYILTDGINAGDGKHQKFFIKDIVNTPKSFDKFYDLVIHIRLGDKVNFGITLSCDAIKNLIKKIELPKNSCIVVNKPKNNFENNFIDILKSLIKDTHNIDINIESNDILTDFHIMKNAKILVCSFWVAAIKQSVSV